MPSPSFLSFLERAEDLVTANLLSAGYNRVSCWVGRNEEWKGGWNNERTAMPALPDSVRLREPRVLAERAGLHPPPRHGQRHPPLLRRLAPLGAGRRQGRRPGQSAVIPDPRFTSMNDILLDPPLNI